MRKPLFNKLAALVVILVYLFTPYAALGGQTVCTCTHNGITCGTDGFLCACCVTEPEPIDATAFSRCRMKIHANPVVQPPALSEPRVVPVIAEAPATSISITTIVSSPGFKPQILKPPAFI